MHVTREGTSTSPTRDFTVATFVVQDGRVLLLWHRKLQRWLPPGGHIEPDELPDEAAMREVAEETGVAVELVGETGLSIENPRQLVRPAGIQLEDIAPGHQHVDLVYFARPRDPARVAAIANAECESAGWYGLDELPEHGLTDEIRLWIERAVHELGAATERTSAPSAR
jgi:ADP-ribose pyrophosphatase YjhB (NUDIX family)